MSGGGTVGISMLSIGGGMVGSSDALKISKDEASGGGGGGRFP